MKGETKDLFAGMAQPAPGSGLSGQSPNQPHRQIDHLEATRRLRMKLRRAQSHSPEEVKAGRLICRHLLAMLDEAQLNDTQVSRGPENDSVYQLDRAVSQ